MIGSQFNFGMRRGGRRPAGPVSLSVFTLILVAMATVFFVFTFHLRSQSAQSAYTQAHGVSRQATVVNVDNIEHQSSSRHGGGSIWYTAQITAAVSPPVGALSQTTVYVPHQVSYADGQTVSVLVDPQAPGYAELPGQPSVTAKDWLGALAGAVICSLLACLLGWQAITKVRARRYA